jgi:chromate transporter
MEDSRTLVALVFVFAPLSLVSIGGGPAVLAEMQHQAVVVHGWVTQREFADLFAISRAAPGPGALLATLIGWQAAGWLGVVTVSLAFFLPSSMMVYVAAHFWNRWRGSAWHTAVEDGFAPIAAALVLAGAFAILQAGGTDPLAWGTALWVAGCRLWRPNLHPLVLLGVGTALFAIGRSIGVHG